MKNAITVLFILMGANSLSAQKPCEDISLDSVKRVGLNTAETLSDLLKNYPAEAYNKIIDYESIEIKGICAGKQLVSKNTTDTLSTEQKLILRTSDTGSIIEVNIIFKYKNPDDDLRGSNRKFKEMNYKVKASSKGKTGLPPCGC